MPTEMAPDRVTMKRFVHTLPLFHDYSVTEKIWHVHLLNTEKHGATQIWIHCRGELVKGGRSIGKLTAKSGRIRSGNFVSISSVA